MAIRDDTKGGFPRGRMSSRRGDPIGSSLAVVATFAILSLVACGPSPVPTGPAAPVASASTIPAPSPSVGSLASPSASASASLDGVSRIDDAAYLAGEAFVLPIGDSGTDWIAPSAAPVMPNGQQAVRVAFLPASCANGAFTIMVDPAPEDGWETSLREDSSEHPYEFQSWPGAQPPSCENGQASTYLQVAYRPFVPRGAIHLVASTNTIGDPPTPVEVVPVFTNADASQPSLTTDGFITLEPVAGPEKPRSATTQELFATDFIRATLPDGTAPTHWGFMVTGCGPVGPKPIVIAARVGGAAPIAVGSCSEGSFSAEQSSLPLPADGTHVAVFMEGGTTKSLLRVSEFQWRGDRP